MPKFCVKEFVLHLWQYEIIGNFTSKKQETFDRNVIDCLPQKTFSFACYLIYEVKLVALVTKSQLWQVEFAFQTI